MPLPFLKNRDDGVGVGPVETLQRKPDGEQPYDMLDAIADDLLSAMETKSKSHLKAALEALVSHIQDVDSEQDQETKGVE